MPRLTDIQITDIRVAAPASPARGDRFAALERLYPDLERKRLAEADIEAELRRRGIALDMIRFDWMLNHASHDVGPVDREHVGALVEWIVDHDWLVYDAVAAPVHSSPTTLSRRTLRGRIGRPPGSGAVFPKGGRDYIFDEWWRIRTAMSYEPDQREFLNRYRVPRDRVGAEVDREGVGRRAFKRFIEDEGFLDWSSFVAAAKAWGATRGT